MRVRVLVVVVERDWGFCRREDGDKWNVYAVSFVFMGFRSVGYVAILLLFSWVVCGLFGRPQRGFRYNEVWC